MTKIDYAGRLLIPKEIRNRLDMAENDYDFIEKDDEIVIRPIQRSYKISESEMEFLRDLLELSTSLGFIDDSQVQMLSEICKLTSSKCHKCDAYMYLDATGSYVCRNCKDK